MTLVAVREKEQVQKKEPVLATHSADQSENYFHLLQQRIEVKQARIGIMGLGYVGLPLACAFAEGGCHTTGFEVDTQKVNAITNGVSYVDDIPSHALHKVTRTRLLKATSDFSELADQDVIIICVPTPLRKSKDPDLSYIVAAAKAIQANFRPGKLILLESTTYPGTTRELLQPLFSEKGYQVGKDYFLAFSPERVDPGNPEFKIHNTPKVVGGITPKCTDLAVLLYSQVVQKIFRVTSPEAAEMTKLLENTFRAVNIGMINEMAIMCNHLGISATEVVEAAKTKPFGYMPFYPGPGIGGHCIPLDPHYLAWKMRAMNVEPRFIELAGAINSGMPEYVVRRTQEILNLEQGKALSKATVLVLGVSYKRDISDVRESPALEVIEQLWRRGAQVRYHDPLVPTLTQDGRMLASEPLDEALLSSADVALIVTDHSNVDYECVLKHARLIIDTRNVLKGREDRRIHKL